MSDKTYRRRLLTMRNLPGIISSLDGILNYIISFYFNKFWFDTLAGVYPPAPISMDNGQLTMDN